MSQADLERFVNDLKNDPALLAELKSTASGVSSVVAFARARGYDVSVEDAQGHMRGKAPTELSDDELDAVVGGAIPNAVIEMVVVEATSAATTLTTTVLSVATADDETSVIATVAGSAVLT